jgi:Putative addiction module component
MTPKAIADQALSLPATLRAELAAQLLSSLDDLPEAEIEPLWLQVAAQRAEQLDRGQSQRISAQEVRRQASALLR